MTKIAIMEYMKNYIKFGILLVFFALLLSCSGRQDTEAEIVSELRFGMTTEPVTLDPLNTANTADGRSILFNVFEGLVKPDSTGRLVPAVAESLRIENGGLLYIFNLRSGIMFQDGSPVTVNDVIFSLQTAINAGFTGFNIISNLESRGTSEIRISLSEPDPEFLPFLTIGIVPESNTDRERNPIGTGPFIIESFHPQEYLRLVKNPHYWQAELPKLDIVTIVFVASTDALVTGLMGGNLDGAVLTGSMLPQLNLDRFDTVPWFSNTVQLLMFNNAQPPLNDLRVRQAINYALDIQGIIDTAFFGLGEPSGSAIIPALSYIYEDSLKDPYPRDLERARSLLREAGFPQGISLEIIVASNYTMHVDTAQVVVSQLAMAGINATIRLVDWGTWLTEVRNDRRYEATIISLDARDVSPRSFLARYHSSHSGNFLNFNNAEYDRLYTEVLLEPNENRRIEIYRRLQHIISENAAGAYIQDILGFWVLRQDAFDGIVNYPLYVNDFSAIYRRN